MDEWTNADRAGKAEQALAAVDFYEEDGVTECCITDLMADLCHLAHREGVDVEMLFARVRGHYEEERE